MKVRIIDYGYTWLPSRSHYNDAGADVCACFDVGTDEVVIGVNEVIKVPLGFGIDLPDGYMALILPRSGLASKGLVCEIAPIDSGYEGEIFDILTNNSSQDQIVKEGDRIGQLVVIPIVVVDFVKDLGEERGKNGFGSTGI